MTSLSIALLALATTPWTYAGFVADPAPPSPPPAPAVIPAPPAAPSTPSVSPTAAPEPATTTVVPPIPPILPVPPVVAAVAPTPHPVHYRLADVSGQLWEHADPAALQAFVQDRNRQLLGSRRFLIPLAAPSWR